jgi:superkiller protein 3
MIQTITIVIIIALTIGSSQAQTGTRQVDTRYAETELSSPTSNEEARKLYNSGYRYFHSGNFNTAILNYKAAIALDSNYSDAYDNCGLSFRRLRQLDSAKYYYKKSIEINTKGTIARGNLALIYVEENKLDSALSQSEQIKKINPEDPEGFYCAADVYIRMKKYEQALENALEAMRLFEIHNPAYLSDAEYYVGLAYYHTGNLDNAKLYMKKAYLNGGRIPEEYLTKLGIP